MKNMKIAVTADQQIDEIVMELERLGYRKIGIEYIFKGKTYIGTNKAGIFTFFKNPPNYCVLTTLAELKEMQNG